MNQRHEALPEQLGLGFTKQRTISGIREHEMPFAIHLHHQIMRALNQQAIQVLALHQAIPLDRIGCTLFLQHAVMRRILHPRDQKQTGLKQNQQQRRRSKRSNRNARTYQQQRQAKSNPAQQGSGEQAIHRTDRAQCGHKTWFL